MSTFVGEGKTLSERDDGQLKGQLARMDESARLERPRTFTVQVSSELVDRFSDWTRVIVGDESYDFRFSAHADGSATGEIRNA